MERIIAAINAVANIANGLMLVAPLRVPKRPWSGGNWPVSIRTLSSIGAATINAAFNSPSGRHPRINLCTIGGTDFETCSLERRFETLIAVRKRRLWALLDQCNWILIELIKDEYAEV